MKSNWTAFAWPRASIMAAQLLTRTGLDWSDKYPSVIAALANVKAKTAYLDGELCGVDDAGLPSFAHGPSSAGKSQLSAGARPGARASIFIRSC
jgi:ATP-dependent DNA ligase